MVANIMDVTIEAFASPPRILRSSRVATRTSFDIIGNAANIAVLALSSSLSDTAANVINRSCSGS